MSVNIMSETSGHRNLMCGLASGPQPGSCAVVHQQNKLLVNEKKHPGGHGIYSVLRHTRKHSNGEREKTFAHIRTVSGLQNLVHHSDAKLQNKFPFPYGGWSSVKGGGRLRHGSVKAAMDGLPQRPCETVASAIGF